MQLFERFKVAVFVTGLATFSACGGGSDAPPTGGNANRAPSAAAGVDQNVDEFAEVILDGSASSDPDAGTTLTYSWEQTAGAAVILSSATAAQPAFDAPDVTAVDTPETLTFRLTVSDGALSASDDVNIAVIDIGMGVNSPPVADAGPDQTVAELTTVTIDGSASVDPDGDMLSFAWLQTGGPNVTLAGADTDQLTFTAPDVTTPVVYSFELTVNDGAASTMDMVGITVQESLSQVTIAGTVNYEFVPASHNNNTCFGLDFAATIPMPIRAATVQLLDSGNTVLGTTASGDDGSYSFDNITANTDVRIRIRAELKRNGAPSWDVEIRDNVDTSANPPPLGSRPLYVFDSAPFNTGVFHITDKVVLAETGWDGFSYASTRAAAPFAILDSIYIGMQLILSVDATAGFSPLDAFWSVNNTTVSGVPTNIDTGEFGPAGFYRSDIDSLFLVGDADVNTVEFDFGVTLHEWGHYFEDNFSRSNSVGGRHFLDEPIEARTAFGEGWGHAVAAMASGDPMNCNTGAVSGAGSFGFNLETTNIGPQGWYNELSIGGLLLDLADDRDDGVDDDFIGFEPLYNVMTGSQVTTEAFTSLFSFASLLRTDLMPAEQTFLDSLLSTENIETSGLDIWASTQANIDIAPNNARDVMPLYTDYAPDGSVLNICVNDDHDPDGDGNKPANYRYLRITTSGNAVYDVSIVPNPIPPPTNDPPDPTDPSLPRDRSDPDMSFFVDGVERVRAWSGDSDSELFSTPLLGPGVYLADLKDWRLEDPDKSSDYQSRTCFDVTMTAQ